MPIDYMLLLGIALVLVSVYYLTNKPKWLKEWKEAMQLWELLGEKLLEALADG